MIGVLPRQYHEMPPTTLLGTYRKISATVQNKSYHEMSATIKYHAYLGTHPIADIHETVRY